MHIHQFKFVLLHIFFFLANLYNSFQRYEGFTTVDLVDYDSPCSMLCVYCHFREAYCPHLSDRSNVFL
jgi:hypothetical protein